MFREISFTPGTLAVFIIIGSLNLSLLSIYCQDSRRILFFLFSVFDVIGGLLFCQLKLLNLNKSCGYVNLPG